MRTSVPITHNLKTDGKIAKIIAGAAVLAGLFAAPAQADDSAAAATGNNAFAASFYQQLDQKPGNIFFSPQSISSVLAMAYAGAAGDTAAELKTVLHDSLGAQQLQPALGSLLRSFNAGTTDTYKLNVASALWVEKSYPLQDSFTKNISANYDAALNAVDFKKAPDAAREAVNAWALDHTGGKIKDLLPKNSVNDATRLILASAIYFEGKWETVFQHERTAPQKFMVAADKQPDVPMMGNFFEHCTAKYFEDDSVQALALPYQGGKLSMLVFLPRAKDGLAAVEKSLTPEKLAGWLSHDLSCPKLNVSLPKFKMNYDVDALDALKALGIKTAAEAGAADFSGITGNKDLFIGAVFHKAYVEVDEDGTKAAAATAMEMAAGAAPDPTPPVTFAADHPFLFVIRDDKSGTVLFMGRVADPS